MLSLTHITDGASLRRRIVDGCNAAFGEHEKPSIDLLMQHIYSQLVTAQSAPKKQRKRSAPKQLESKVKSIIRRASEIAQQPDQAEAIIARLEAQLLEAIANYEVVEVGQ
jgi:hypothetical protein